MLYLLPIDEKIICITCRSSDSSRLRAPGGYSLPGVVPSCHVHAPTRRAGRVYLVLLLDGKCWLELLPVCNW